MLRTPEQEHFIHVMSRFDSRFGGGRAIDDADLLDEHDSLVHEEMVLILQKVFGSHVDFDGVLQAHLKPNIEPTPQVVATELGLPSVVPAAAPELKTAAVPVTPESAAPALPEKPQKPRSLPIPAFVRAAVDHAMHTPAPVQQPKVTKRSWFSRAG